jgi:site-specific DNA recombinase
MKEKVAFYVRVSTVDKQDYQYQINSLEDYSKQKVSDGLIDIFEEKVSGYKQGDDRPELKRLLDEIRKDKNKYNCIYVTEISRIGRRAKHVREVLEVLEANQVNLKIKSLGFDLLNADKKPNSNGKLVLNIFIELADTEAIMFKERSKEGIKAGIKAGNAGGGAFLPYGFKKNQNKKLIINEEEADVIRLIYDLYKQGNGVKKIANILNNRNIKTRTHIAFEEKTYNKTIGKLGKDSRWVDKTVDDILLNPIYKGKRRYWGGKSLPNEKKNAPLLIEMDGEPILNPPTLWDDCMEIRNTKTHKNFLTKYTYLLKNKIVCAVCGRNYFAKFKPISGGDKVYICSSRLIKGNRCQNFGVNISLVESSIFNEIVSSDSILKHINENDEIKKNLINNREELINEIQFTNTTISKLDKEIKSSIELQIEAKSNFNTLLVERYSQTINSKMTQLDNLSKTLPKLTRKLELTQHAIKKNTSIKTTAKELIKNKHDRIKLKAIFHSIIEKVYIIGLDNDTIFADVHIVLDGIKLPISLKLFLDSKGIRKAEKIKRYIPFINIDKELVYNNNILELPKARLVEFHNIVKENLGLLGYVDYTIIPISNQLNVLDEKI